MAKKSFLERIGIVESSAQESQYVSGDLEAMKGQLSTYETSIEEPTSDVLEIGEGFFTIEETYEAAQLQDLSTSIFKVDEFSKVLPDNLPTDVKRQSVVGILSASGLSLESLVDDAEKRLGVLNEVSSKTSQNTVEFVIEKETEITKLLEMVDVLRQDINNRKTSQEKQNEIVDTEKERINKIVTFVSPK